jgi:elongation factor P--(R)-beta-lysine ligase
MDMPLRARLERHARFIDAIRAFFTARGYVSVDTPTLSPFLIPEPAIEVFRTDLLSLRRQAGEPPTPLWLIPSPELWMKRLLASGSGNIFQVSRSFRNGDFESPLHNPEFSLLEWYTLRAGYLDSISLTEDLFAHLLPYRAPGVSRERLAPPFARLSMEEAFRSLAGIELAACPDAQAMREAGLRQGVTLPAEPTWEEAFHIVFLTLVEPRLPRDRPLALIDYPVQIPTTARRKPGTPWTERWELFIEGAEILNCYTEETDAEALRALIAAETERKRDCRVQHRIDKELAEIFPPGFPSCSGAALGVDRLEMLFSGEKSVEGVIFFPLSAILPRQSETG